MSDFRSLKGLFIKHVSSDPDNLAEGDIWYNTTTQTFKVAPLIEAWASGNNMNTARRRLAGAGIQTAALAISGTADPPLYNQVESYDGSSWTEIADVNTAREEHAASGTSTAALTFGGKAGSATANTESWNNTSWTEVANLNTARQELTGDGATNTAAIAVGGAPERAVAETWNGTAWTEVADLNTGRGYGGQTAGTSNTSALAIGGTSPDSAKTESWNGTSWRESSDLAAATVNNAAAGTTASALNMGGRNPSVTATTEEWTSVATSRSVDTS